METPRIVAASLLAIALLPLATSQPPQQPQKAFVDKYCTACHNEKSPAGGLALSRFAGEEEHAFRHALVRDGLFVDYLSSRETAAALGRTSTGAMRAEAAKIGDVTLQIVRDWVVKFNAHGPDGLIDRKAPGQPSKLNDAHRAALLKMIEEGPTPAIHGVVRWRLIDLAQWMFEEFRLSIAVQTLSRELRKMGYRKLSARPRHHAQAEGAIEDFKKHFQPAWRKSRVKKASASTR